MAVVLPAPFGPTKPNIWPRSTVKEHPVEGDDVSIAAREVPQLEHASSGSAAAVKVRCG